MQAADEVCRLMEMSTIIMLEASRYRSTCRVEALNLTCFLQAHGERAGVPCSKVFVIGNSLERVEIPKFTPYSYLN